MERTNKNLLICAMVFAVALVTSNVVAAKIVDTGIPLFGSTISIPGAVFCYAITFLMTDVVGEVWGRKEARTIVLGGFVCQLIATGLIVLTQALPSANAAMQASYEMLLGQNALFMIGSLAAYLAAQSWDVFIFHAIRNRFMAAHPHAERWRWVWNNGSTMTSQMIDTTVFITVSFGIGFGWLFSLETLPQLGAMMVGQYGVKFVLAALDTPLFYLMTRKAHAPAQAAA